MKEGMRGLFRGARAYTVGLFVGGLAWLIVSVPLKAVLIHLLRMPPALAYLSFHFIATPPTVAVVYPFSTVSRMQMLAGAGQADGPAEQLTERECARRLYAMPGGWRNFYRGFWPYCLSLCFNHCSAALTHLIAVDLATVCFCSMTFTSHHLHRRTRTNAFAACVFMRGNLCVLAYVLVSVCSFRMYVCMCMCMCACAQCAHVCVCVLACLCAFARALVHACVCQRTN